jgi:hypothetical protein
MSHKLAQLVAVQSRTYMVPHLYVLQCITMHCSAIQCGVAHYNSAPVTTPFWGGGALAALFISTDCRGAATASCRWLQGWPTQGAMCVRTLLTPATHCCMLAQPSTCQQLQPASDRMQPGYGHSQGVGRYHPAARQHDMARCHGCHVLLMPLTTAGLATLHVGGRAYT